MSIFKQVSFKNNSKQIYVICRDNSVNISIIDVEGNAESIIFNIEDFVKFITAIDMQIVKSILGRKLINLESSKKALNIDTSSKNETINNAHEDPYFLQKELYSSLMRNSEKVPTKDETVQEPPVVKTPVHIKLIDEHIMYNKNMIDNLRAIMDSYASTKDRAICEDNSSTGKVMQSNITKNVYYNDRDLNGSNTIIFVSGKDVFEAIITAKHKAVHKYDTNGWKELEYSYVDGPSRVLREVIKS